MRTPATESILGFNETVALVGTLEGTVRSELLPINQTQEERLKWVQNNFRNPKHTQKDTESIPIRFYGALEPADEQNYSYLPITTAQVQLKDYEDSTTGLVVRAIFNPVLNEWTVADL